MASKAKLLLIILFGGCIFTSLSHAESEIKLWKSQTIYVPMNTQIFFGGNERTPIKLSTNLIIRNTDASSSINITEINYYNSEDKLIKTYLDSPKKLKPRVSTYIFIQKHDAGGVGS